MPVSTTPAVVGAVLGVGIAGGRETIDSGAICRIFASWITTIPAGALLSIGLFFVLKSRLS